MSSQRTRILLLVLLGWTLGTGSVWAEPSPATDTVGLRRAERDGIEGCPFDLTVTALTPLREKARSFNVRDATGPAALGARGPLPNFVPGDTIRVRGTIVLFDNIQAGSVVSELTVLGHGPAPEPRDITPEELYSGRHVFDLVRVTGLVTDAFRDETNPDFVFVVLNCVGGTVYVASPFLPAADIEDLVDATVSVTGTVYPHHARSPRARLGYEIELSDLADLTVIHPPPADPYDVPLLDGSIHDIWRPKSESPLRRRLVGTVAAVWQGHKTLLRTPDGASSVVDFADGRLPGIGEAVEAAGIPETDLYHLNLSRAIWRPADLPTPAPESVTDVDAATLLTDGAGQSQYDVHYNGRLVRLTGHVNALPRLGDADSSLLLQCGEFLVNVDASAAPSALDALQPGHVVSVTGICIMEAENWRPQSPFPHIRRLAIVLRTPNDLAIISRPPWWTPRRFLLAVGVLFAALLAILAWNVLLQRLVARKSREALREQLGHLKARLKTDERTRLAVELHDSLSQSLTGIALELKAAETSARTDLDTSLEHLDIAEQSLASCHTELRNCLWDLRNGMLECPDLNKAIVHTVSPQIGAVSLSVDCDIPRSRLTDETTYAILKILRELAVNAVHHGRATAVEISGAMAGSEIRLVVRDDGCGFDPATAPGPAQGHFGLLGVQERVDSFDGKLAVDSRAGSGTTVSIVLPQPNDND